MTTLYTIDIGDYSDRRTIAIVDKHQKEIIEQHGLLDGFTETYTVRITPFELNKVTPCPAGYTAWRVSMYIKDGKVQNVCDKRLYALLDTHDRDYYNYESDMDFVRTVAATSEEHAVKIVNEMRTIWKAETNWQPPSYS